MDNTSRLSTDTASGRLITYNYTHVKHANARRERIWSNADMYTTKTDTYTNALCANENLNAFFMCAGESFRCIHPLDECVTTSRMYYSY